MSFVADVGARHRVNAMQTNSSKNPHLPCRDLQMRKAVQKAECPLQIMAAFVRGILEPLDIYTLYTREHRLIVLRAGKNADRFSVQRFG